MGGEGSHRKTEDGLALDEPVASGAPRSDHHAGKVAPGVPRVARVHAKHVEHVAEVDADSLDGQQRLARQQRARREGRGAEAAERAPLERDDAEGPGRGAAAGGGEQPRLQQRPAGERGAVERVGGERSELLAAGARGGGER